MDKVKIKRVKKERKKITTKEKILAGLGLGSTLIGGAGAIAPKNPSTEFVRTVNTDTDKGSADTGSSNDKKTTLKQKIKDIFGLKSAKAAEMNASLPNSTNGSNSLAYNVSSNSDGTTTLTANGVSTTFTNTQDLLGQISSLNQQSGSLTPEQQNLMTAMTNFYYANSYNNSTSVIEAQEHPAVGTVTNPTVNIAGAQQRTVTLPNGTPLTYQYVQVGDRLIVQADDGSAPRTLTPEEVNRIKNELAPSNLKAALNDIVNNNLYHPGTPAGTNLITPSAGTQTPPTAPVVVQVSNVVSINNNDSSLSQRAIQGDFNGQRYALSTENGNLYNGNGDIVTTANSGLSNEQITAIKTALQNAHHEYAIVVNSDMTPHNLWDDTGHLVEDQTTINRIFSSYSGGTAMGSASVATGGTTTPATPYSASNDMRTAIQNGDVARFTQILQSTGQDFYSLVTDQALRNSIISFANSNNIQGSSFGANTVGKMILGTTATTSTVNPGTGTQFWSTGGVTEGYNNAVKPFDLTIQKNSSGAVVSYTISINDNGRTITQTYTPAALNQFLSNTWSSSDNFLNASRDNQLLFAAGVNARLIDSNIGLGIANLPVPNTSHVQNVKYVDSNGQLVTTSQSYGVNGMSFQADANWVASMFPGSTVRDVGFPGGTTDSWSPSVSSSDSRRYYEVVLPNGSRINVGLFLLNNINTSNGRTTVNVSQDDLRYFVAPNSSVVAQSTYAATGGNATTPGYVPATSGGTGGTTGSGVGSNTGNGTASVGTPSVSSVNYQGGMLLINGNNFNSAQANGNKIEVYDGTSKVADFTVSSGSANLIVANLPTALQSGKTYTLKITANNQVSNQMNFSVAGTVVGTGTNSQRATVTSASLSDYNDYLKTINTSTSGITTSSQMALWLNGQNLENSSVKIYKVSGTTSTDVTNTFNISAPSVVSVGSGQQVGFGVSPKTTATAGVYRVEIRNGSTVVNLPSSVGFTLGQTSGGSTNTGVTIITSSLPEATAGSAYSVSLSSSQSGLWSVSGAPSWMNIDSSSGRLYGTPPASASGTTVITASLTVGSQTVSKNLSLNVKNITNQRAPSVLNYEVAGLNKGISADTSGLQIQDPYTVPTTYTQSSASMVYQAPQQINESAAVSASVINTDAQMVIITSVLPTPQVGQSYNAQMVGYCNIPGNISWGVSSGSLPTGLTMNHLGVITGTPTQNGSFTFTVRGVANDGSADATKQFTLNVGSSAQNIQPSVLNVADDEGVAETTESGANLTMASSQPSVLNVADDEGSGDFDESGNTVKSGTTSVSGINTDDEVEYDEVSANSGTTTQSTGDDEVEYDEVSGIGSRASSSNDDEVEYDEVGAGSTNSSGTIQTFQNTNTSSGGSAISTGGSASGSGSSSSQAGNYLNQEINNVQSRINQLESAQALSSSERQELINLRAEVISLRQALQALQGSSSRAAGVVTYANSSSESGTYTVKKGDTLWDISRRFYGDGTQWRKILEANPQSLSRPGNVRTLRIGYELKIPGISTAQNTQAQVYGATESSGVRTFSLENTMQPTQTPVATQSNPVPTAPTSSQNTSSAVSSSALSANTVNARAGGQESTQGGNVVMPSVSNVGDDEEVEVIE